MRLSALLPVLLALGACDSPRLSRAYFQTDREAFERVVQLIDACRPTHHFVSDDGLHEDGLADGVTCDKADQDISNLRRELTRNGFRFATYNVNADELVSVSIAPRIGCQVFIYQTQANPSGGRHINAPEADDFERYPLTGPPHHWFCENIGF